jgi:hypothetical protein
MTQAISQDKKVNPEVDAPGLTIKHNFKHRIVFDEVLDVNIHLDYRGGLESWALTNFQGLGESFESRTELYLDFRARLRSTPVHAVHRRVGKGPSPYPCLTIVELALTHWRLTRSNMDWKKIKEQSRVDVWVRGVGRRLVKTDEAPELTLSKVDEKFDLEQLSIADRVEFSARLTVGIGLVWVELAQESSIERIGKPRKGVSNG